MKKLLISTLLAVGLVSPALAKNSENHAAPSAGFDWTGGYVGLQAGYAWGRSTGEDHWPSYLGGGLVYYGDVDPSGFLGGLYAGYNYQFPNGFVLGAEADLNYAHLTGSVSHLMFPGGFGIAPGSARAEMTWNGAARIRAGYAFGRILPYVTGGVAFGGYKYTGYYGKPAPEAKTQTGWTIGTGLEYAFNKNLIGRIEYRYTDFGSFRYHNPVLSILRTQVDLRTSALQIGLAYKF